MCRSLGRQVQHGGRLPRLQPLRIMQYRSMGTIRHLSDHQLPCREVYSSDLWQDVTPRHAGRPEHQ